MHIRAKRLKSAFQLYLFCRKEFSNGSMECNSEISKIHCI
nr:MAG TPA: hypothetical protein [Caudoviricetes sp.]